MKTEKFLEGEYKQFEAREHQFVQACHTTLKKYTSAGLDFIGFVYNGVVLPECRDQTIALSASAVGNLGLNEDQASRFVERLTQLYLDTYGVGTTINNLILEADYFRPEGKEPLSVQLSFGGRVSFIKEPDTKRRRHINISNGLSQALGIKHPIWNKIAAELKKNVSISRESARVLEELTTLITEGSRYVVFFERLFLQDLEKYLFLHNSKPCPSELLKVLPAWLRALQGLFMFVHLFGRHWITVPVKPTFMKNFKDIGFRIPCCAITAISYKKPNPKLLRKIAEDIEEKGATGIAKKFEDSSRLFVQLLENREKTLHDGLKRVFQDWTPDIVGPRVCWTEDIQKFLDLGLKLVGKRHEQKPLSFILLCASAGSLLRYHVRSARKPWVLKSVMKLTPLDFPNMEHRPVEDQLNALVFAIEANSFLLQESGRALFFFPVSSQFAPCRMVEFEPFDPREVDLLLRDFTRDEENENGALAIHVRGNDAKLFAAGKKAAICSGKQWQKCGDGLDADRGHDLLRIKINALSEWADLSELEHERLNKICSAVVQVSTRGYGALFFLTRRGMQPRSTNLAPVWASSNREQIDDMADISLAAYAGMDGETCVNLDSGVCETRQFCHVPAEEFLDILKRTKGRLCLNPEYAEAYDKMEKRCGKMEQQDELYKMGTRHQKALRITWAKRYRKATIAITVSSDGPIRLWYEGFPVSKWPSAS
jgi:hypothetical protein